MAVMAHHGPLNQEEGMLVSLKDLKGYSIQAKDDEIGKVNDFYFDDQTWTVRYLVDKAGVWLFGRQVLISPASVREINSDQMIFLVALTREQVEKSPKLDKEKMLSKDAEKSLINYYQWPSYLGGSDSLAEAGYTQTQAPYPLSLRGDRDIVQDAEQEMPGLKSSEDVLGYHISTNNGDLGFVDDLIVSSKTWEIRYMVIDAKKGLNGKKILIAPEWIDWISWKQRRVSVSMDKEKIQGCPNFDLSLPIGRDYEELLYDHYECKKYWDDNAR
jgi:uncharacterized protein YrrD